MAALGGDLRSAAVLLEKVASKTRDARLATTLIGFFRSTRSQPAFESAHRELQTLVLEREDDDVGIQAAFWLAALTHRHAREGGGGTAAERYSLLFSRHPGSLLGQLAAVRALQIELFDALVPPAKRAARIAMAESTLSAQLTHPLARRDLRLVLAQAALLPGTDAQEAARLFAAAAAAPLLSPSTRDDLRVQAGSFAWRAGDVSGARRHWEDFIDGAPNDPRSHFVREVLAGRASYPP